MAIYRFEGPDGKIHRVEAESPEAAQRGLEAHFRPKVGSDMAQSALAGFTQGVRGLADQAVAGNPILPRGLIDGVMNGLSAATTAVLPKNSPVAVVARALPVVAKGEGYTPKTVPGEYARTVASFAPGAVLVPGSLAMKAAATVVPALASETAGQIPGVKGSRWEGVARIAGALAGGAVTPAALDATRARVTPKVAPRPVLRAAERVELALRRDGMTPTEAIAAGRANPKAPAFMAGGENVVGLAELAAQSPGAARKTLTEAILTNQGRVGDEVRADIGQALGGRGDYFATLGKARQQRANLAKPYRDSAFSTPIDPAKFEAEIAPILPRVPQSAIRLAAEIARRDGRNPNDVGFVGSPASGELPELVTIKQPTMETLHFIKKGMDQDLNQFRDGLGRLNLEGQPLAASTSKVRSELGQAMRRSSKDYDSFMRTWGDESDHVDALRLGRDVFSSKPEMGYEQLKAHVAKMNTAAREMYARGVGEALINQVRSAKGGVGAMRQLLRSEEYRDRVRLAFPSDEAYSAFIDSAARRVQEQERSTQVLGNSRTFARQAAAKDDEQAIDPLDVAGAVIDGAGNPVGAAAKGVMQALKSKLNKDRSAIDNPQSNAVLGQALTSADEMERLLDLLAAERRRTAIRPLGPWTGDAMRLVAAQSPQWPPQ